MMQIDKRNGDVCFNDREHKYFDINDEGRQYISVTTLIGRYEREFRKDFWSSYKAMERLLSRDEWAVEKKAMLSSGKFDTAMLEAHGVSADDFERERQAILDEWDLRNREACERGTRIHAEMEESMYRAGGNVSLRRFGIGGRFECRKDYSDLDLEYGVYPEYLISRVSDDGILRLAGQIDLIVKSGNEITVVDWKTNGEIRTKGVYDSRIRGTVNMKYPLNNLPDVNFSHYTMQLSTYAWMLQKINPEFVIKDLVLVHFPHEGGEVVYHCDYRKEDVERMLRHYKKELVLLQGRDRRKRIEY